jgi:ketosteroid isomerase-like protein
VVLAACNFDAMASEAEQLQSMTESFLATSDTEAAHASFWAEDLIYTSSAGLRFGKADIMQGFNAEDEPADEPGMTYSGEEFDARVHGDMAIVAFKLVGTPPDGAGNMASLYYFNTGTFLRRDGRWQVIAWQATKILPAE